MRRTAKYPARMTLPRLIAQAGAVAAQAAGNRCGRIVRTRSSNDGRRRTACRTRATAIAKMATRTAEVMDTLTPPNDVRIPPETATHTDAHRRTTVRTSTARIHEEYAGLSALADRACLDLRADRSWASRIRSMNTIDVDEPVETDDLRLNGKAGPNHPSVHTTVELIVVALPVTVHTFFKASAGAGCAAPVMWPLQVRAALACGVHSRERGSACACRCSGPAQGNNAARWQRTGRRAALRG